MDVEAAGRKATEGLHVEPAYLEIDLLQAHLVEVALGLCDQDRCLHVPDWPRPADADRGQCLLPARRLSDGRRAGRQGEEERERPGHPSHREGLLFCLLFGLFIAWFLRPPKTRSAPSLDQAMRAARFLFGLFR